MTRIEAWATRAPNIGDVPHFATLLGRLLNQAELVVGAHRFQLVELELYLWNDSHPDPFAHRQDVQAHTGRWYVHRTGSGYRSGSFKGLDLTFGDATSRVGVLIRSLRRTDGTLLEGPSLVVDSLLSFLGETQPLALDRRLASYRIWDESAPLAVVASEVPRQAAVFRTGRVGLSLKRARRFPTMPQFLDLPYRFLTEPRRLRKGRPQLVVALHQQGKSAAEIVALTGTRLGVVESYLAEFEAGRGMDVEAFFGRDLSTAERCRVLGALAL